MDYQYTYADDAGPDGPQPAPVTAASANNTKSIKGPQQSLNNFWAGLITKSPGKVFQIFPRTLYEHLLPQIKASGAASQKHAAESYESAVAECKERVKRILRECDRTNEKFTDPDFDIESDPMKNCLKGLSTNVSTATMDVVNAGSGSVGSDALRSALALLLNSGVLSNTAIPMDPGALTNALDDDTACVDDSDFSPGSIHRIDYIFEKPRFVIDGYSTTDVNQGAMGDCWWVAAVANLCSMPELMDKICVEQDAECGVYGFVFFRDGEWISTVIDDNLFLTKSDWDALGDYYDPAGENERKYRKSNQTGSDALYFGKCHDPNETWLPLLEKAYAKVHGDYKAIVGGDSGEAVEDMTGGVTSCIYLNKVLSKDRLWNELLNVDRNFIFSASSPGNLGGDTKSRAGLTLNHAYSVLKAVEAVGEDLEKVRLLLIRNPWGSRSYQGVGEWNGPWSDGSKEWTLFWMKKLKHRFGDDGIFWISFEDFCSKFQYVNRTRLFDSSWTVVQQWTSVNVSYVSGYMTTKFLIEVTEPGIVVVVLSQLDTRYFRGLEGQYSFYLNFLLREAKAPLGEHLVRARGDASNPDRSVSAEIVLQPGIYEVLPKIIAKRYTSDPIVEDVVKKAALENPQKLRQIGLNYDIAHAKGGFEQTEAEKKAEEKKEKAEQKEKAAEEEKAKEEEKKPEGTVQPKDGDAVSEEPKKDNTKEEVKEQPNREIEPPNGEVEKQTDTETEKQPDGVVEQPKDETKDETKDDTKDESKEEIKEEIKEEKKDDTKDDTKADNQNATEKDGPAPAPAPAPETNTATKNDAAEENPNAWNAVAVVGLRVYAKDPKVKISLIKASNPEEASALNVDGAHKAEATM